MPPIDITRPLRRGIPVYPGEAPFERTVEQQVLTGPWQLQISHISLSAHTGSHMDAPLHVHHEEAELPPSAVHQIPLPILVGPAVVVDLRACDRIDAGRIHALGPLPPRVLLRTDNSDRPYSTSRFCALDPTAGEALLSRAPLLVGIDGPSIDPPEALDLPVHRTLLGAGVVVVEGLDLGRADPGEYELTCLPLLLDGSDGAPVRAILTK